MPKPNLKLIKRSEIGSWIHALKAPISKDTKFEMPELMRLDLVDHLEFVTRNSADADKGSLEWSVREIKKVSRRLAEISLLMPIAVAKAVKHRRVEFRWQVEERGRAGSAPEVAFSVARITGSAGLTTMLIALLTATKGTFCSMTAEAAKEILASIND